MDSMDNDHPFSSLNYDEDDDEDDDADDDDVIAVVPSHARRDLIVNYISEEGLQRPTRNLARNKK